MIIMACATNPAKKMPPWITNPNLDGHTGGCGSAGLHIKGPHAQRQLAISRAIDELARQQSVEVTNIIAVKTSGNRDRFKSEVDSFSVQTSSGQSIQAGIRAVWQDPRTERLYVWAVIDNNIDNNNNNDKDN